jgi:hypothetical protein
LSLLADESAIDSSAESLSGGSILSFDFNLIRTFAVFRGISDFLQQLVTESGQKISRF